MDILEKDYRNLTGDAVLAKEVFPKELVLSLESGGAQEEAGCAEGKTLYVLLYQAMTQALNSWGLLSASLLPKSMSRAGEEGQLQAIPLLSRNQEEVSVSPPQPGCPTSTSRKRPKNIIAEKLKEDTDFYAGEERNRGQDRVRSPRHLERCSNNDILGLSLLGLVERLGQVMKKPPSITQSRMGEGLETGSPPPGHPSWLSPAQLISVVSRSTLRHGIQQPGAPVTAWSRILSLLSCAEEEEKQDQDFTVLHSTKAASSSRNLSLTTRVAPVEQAEKWSSYHPPGPRWRRSHKVLQSRGASVTTQALRSRPRHPVQVGCGAGGRRNRWQHQG